MFSVIHVTSWRLLPTLLHVHVIKHLNEGDSDFVYVLHDHRLLQELRRELDPGKKLEHQNRGTRGFGVGWGPPLQYMTVTDTPNDRTVCSQYLALATYPAPLKAPDTGNGRS